MKIPARNILIRCPNWVGDAVMATPALRCIREHCPDARISLLAKPYVRGALENAPWADEIIEYDPDRAHRGWLGYLALIERLRVRHFDLAVIMPHSLSAAWMAWLAGARRRVGYSRGDRGWLLTDRLPSPREGRTWLPVPKTDYYLRLCETIGCPVRSTKTELFVSDSAAQQADRMLAQRGVPPDALVIGLNPGARFGSSKCWSPKSFAQVADALIERYGCRVVILSAPDEDQIVRAIELEMKHKAVDFLDEPMTLELLKPIVRRLALLVTTDTGTRHFAVAFDKPVVVIMGPTDPRHTACNLDKTTVLRVDVPCGPCHLRVCPTDHRCMTLVTPDHVLAAVDDLMRKHVPRS
ncbi:MAG: lipopolysaccharide heptosyltransferase II [Planctomycetes bacterium]|nr:lipopolysaccharide heptosyltransferase II [Planctomycetota bacterium]MBM4079528.1 lipopolysaccharide heptosyltransferase II [Planctomycetota bacterium]